MQVHNSESVSRFIIFCGTFCPIIFCGTFCPLYFVGPFVPLFIVGTVCKLAHITFVRSLQDRQCLSLVEAAGEGRGGGICHTNSFFINSWDSFSFYCHNTLPTSMQFHNSESVSRFNTKSHMHTIYKMFAAYIAAYMYILRWSQNSNGLKIQGGRQFSSKLAFCKSIKLMRSPYCVLTQICTHTHMHTINTMFSKKWVDCYKKILYSFNSASLWCPSLPK